MARDFDTHVCPHCGQRNRIYGHPVCSEGQKQFDQMVEVAADALLAGGQIGEVWDSVFAWAIHLGQQTLARLQTELNDLQAKASVRKGEIQRAAVAEVAGLARGKEGSIPQAVREAAVAKKIRDMEWKDETLKKAHGRGLGAEDLRRHLEWLQARMADSRKRRTA